LIGKVKQFSQQFKLFVFDRSVVINLKGGA